MSQTDGMEDLANLSAEIESALKAMFMAYTRLLDLGWSPAVSCPKDGTLFDAIEAGSSGIGTCHYEGAWPDGRWWMREAGYLWSAQPILWRAKQDG